MHRRRRAIQYLPTWVAAAPLEEELNYAVAMPGPGAVAEEGAGPSPAPIAEPAQAVAEQPAAAVASGKREDACTKEINKCD